MIVESCALCLSVRRWSHECRTEASLLVLCYSQGLAILISCLLYHHAISPTGVIGIFIVFGAIFFRIFSSFRHRQQKRSSQTPAAGVAKV